MKSKLWLWLLLLAALGWGAFATTRWLAAGRVAPSLAELSDAGFLAHELNLTSAQVAELEKIQGVLGAQLADCCARHCALRAQLAPLLGDGTNSHAQAQKLIEAMSRENAASELATWRHIQQVRALLTPVQQARYDALVGGCLCGTCNMTIKPSER